MEALQQYIDRFTDPATQWLGAINNWVYTYILLAALIGTGIYLTLRTRAVQFRRFGEMLRHLRYSRREASGGISSFQAFTMGMATRIGIGNITGVALAIILGGPGALLWMWLVALIGMATAFAEATLAQLFKTRHKDGTFRGGPAAYIQYGLRSRALGVGYAIFMLFCMVFAMPMVQANTISQVMLASHHIATWVTALVVAVLAGIVLLGGVRAVARVTEWISPLMALAYLATALVVILVNLDQLHNFFAMVFLSAFGLHPALAGLGGGVLAAVINGVRRGLFSNEAGMGTNPCAAATATVPHPVHQGLIQSFGVFLDTVLVCTATGFIILTSGLYSKVELSEELAGHLTTDAILSSLGSWMAWPVSIMIFFFGFSSILGAFAYAEVNMVFLGIGKGWQYLARILTVASAALGAMLALRFVWALMDTSMFLVTIFNLAALVALSGWVAAALRDYERQRAGGVLLPVFDPQCAQLPRELVSDAWPRGVAPWR